jgi:hypothetical protein
VFALFAAGIFSSIFKVFVPHMTSGFTVIIAALGAAVLAAILFPVSEREIEEERGRA